MFQFAGPIGNVVEVAFRVGEFVVDRRQEHGTVHAHYGKACFYCACGCNGVAYHRLVGADGNLLRSFSQNPFDRQGLYLVILESRSSMSINVLDIGGSKAGICDGPLHGKAAPSPLG